MHAGRGFALGGLELLDAVALAAQVEVDALEVFDDLAAEPAPGSRAPGQTILAPVDMMAQAKHVIFQLGQVLDGIGPVARHRAWDPLVGAHGLSTGLAAS